MFVSNVLHGLLHLYRVAHNLELALFGKLAHALHGGTRPAEGAEVSQITSLHFAYQNLGKQGFYLRINLVAVGGAADDKSAILEDIGNDIRRIALAHIVHHDVLDALCRKFRRNGFRHLFRVAVHGTVSNDHTFVSGVAAQLVVDTDNLGYVFRPHRSVCRADGRNGQTAQLSQRLLHRRAVLAYDVRIVANHLIPVSVQIDAGIQEPSVQRAETAETVTGEKNSFRFVKSHHRLGPVHHRGHIETELMMSQSQKILVFHHVLFARHAIKALYHAESLLVAHDDDVGVMLLYQTDRTRMVRFHMVDDEILDGALADDILYLAQIHLEIADVYRIDQSDHFVVYQVRVVGNPIRQRPHTFKQMLIAVIHSHVVDFSFYHCFWVHNYSLFRLIPYLKLRQK